MSITDELREWLNEYGCEYGSEKFIAGSFGSIGQDRLLAIADRIDAELAERYVALPLDADGKPIRVGDVMEFSEFEIEHPVTRTVEGIGQGTFFAWCGERGYQQHEPKRYRHHRPPTVEDILREFAEKMAENTAMYVAESWDADEREEADAAAVAEYAKRLRLKDDE